WRQTMAKNVVRLVPPPQPAPGARSSIAKAAAGKDKPAKPYEARDDKVQGLLLRIQPTGLRTYYVQLARGRRNKIGRAGVFTLEQARESARTILRDPEAAARTTRAGITLSEY